MIDYLSGKKILFVAAHQDDESMYFGGTLSQIKDIAKSKVISVTKPGAQRPDFKHRMGAFIAAVDMVNARYSIYDIINYRHDTPFSMACEPQLAKGIEIIKNEIREFDPDIVFTHGEHGDPAEAYENGHIMHKFCHRITKEAVSGRTPIFTSAISTKDGASIVEYDVDKKKEMVKLYEPFWEPISRGYLFCYDPEVFGKIA